MPVTPIVLFEAKSAENVNTTQYVSSGETTIIDSFTGCNTTGSVVTLTVNIAPVGLNNQVSASASNQIISYNIPANTTYTFPELCGQILGANDGISTIAGAANSITIRASGRTVV